MTRAWTGNSGDDAHLVGADRSRRRENRDMTASRRATTPMPTTRKRERSPADGTRRADTRVADEQAENANGLRDIEKTNAAP